MILHGRIAAGGADFLDALGDQQAEVVLVLDQGRIGGDAEAEKRGVSLVQVSHRSFEIASFPGGLGFGVQLEDVLDRDRGVIGRLAVDRKDAGS